jgi:hypothetical protein
LGGTQEIFEAVSEDFLGGAGKAEDAKLPGAGIIPKLCPMERLGMERMDGNRYYPGIENGSHMRRETGKLRGDDHVKRVGANDG